MTTMTVEDLMAVQPVIPVITIERVEDAIPLAAALAGNGLRVLEVTLRTAAALDCIREMAKVPNAIVGAGTILSASDVTRALKVGATFIVTPGLSAATVTASREAGIPILPGIATATELMAGLDLGVTRFKFFPPNRPAAAPCSMPCVVLSAPLRSAPPAESRLIWRATISSVRTSPASAAAGSRPTKLIRCKEVGRDRRARPRSSLASTSSKSATGLARVAHLVALRVARDQQQCHLHRHSEGEIARRPPSPAASVPRRTRTGSYSPCRV